MRIGSARQPGTVAMSGGGAAEAVTDPSDPSDGRDWPYRPPQRLLLASDGSPQSLRAARWLARLCLALRGVDVVVLHVVPTPGQVFALGLSEGPLPSASTVGTRGLSRRAAVVLERTLDALDTDCLSVRPYAELGDPPRVIHRLAHELACDAIVIGAGKRRAGRNTRCAGVAQRVLRQPPCPVLLVP